MIVNYNLLISDEYTFSEEDIPAYVYDVFGQWSGKTGDQISQEIDDYRSCDFPFDVTDRSSFRDLLNTLLDLLRLSRERFYMCYSMVFVEEKGELVNIQNYDYRLKDFMKLYDVHDHLQLYFIFGRWQGDIFGKEGIRYYMPSSEAGHNRPHIHVCINRDFAASVDILTGEILVGDIPKKEHKKVQKYIADNKDKLLDYWNKHTSGLDVVLQ